MFAMQDAPPKTMTINNTLEPCATKRQIGALSQMIGNTPLLAVHLKFRGIERTIYAKAEHYNLTGSIKDRMALNILKKALECGALRPGMRIAEATSGNAGIAMTAIGRALGMDVRIYMPDWMSDERKSLLSGLGAELALVSREEGGFLGAIDQTEKLAATEDGVFLPCQFSNSDNVEAHTLTTGPEILRQLDSIGKTPAAFVAGVGTGGTVMGVGRALRAFDETIAIHPMEPAESPTLSTGYKVGKHRIQGVSDDFIPAVLDLPSLSNVVSASDGDGIIMAQRLAKELGLGLGISSGANLIAALKVAEAYPVDAPIVTIFCDDNKKYLSTDLGREEPVKEGYLSPDVELLGFESVRG